VNERKRNVIKRSGQCSPDASNERFISGQIRVAGKEDEKWQDRGRELVRLRESGKKMPDEWIEKDRLLY